MSHHNKLPPHSYIVLPPLAAQLLHHFTPSEQITTSLLHHLTPLAAQLFHNFAPSEQITPSLIHNFTPFGSPTHTSFYPLWTNYPLTLTPFYPPWKPNSYLILLPPGQITPSLLHHFTPLGSPTLTSFYPL